MTNTPVRAVQVLAIFLGLLMVAGFILLIMKKITTTNFWILTGVLGALAVFAVPRLKKYAEK